ncbi:tRNA synthetases class I-domain-containing protein [Hyaloraphidium curvatum]|nr:tRNA synthetases class I-domain-containing protein [Hyaloraphidium curvatum]
MSSEAPESSLPGGVPNGKAQDASPVDGAPKEKSKKELEKEAAKAAKLAKFEAKEAARKAAEAAKAVKGADGDGKTKKVKESRAEAEEAYVDTTKPGEKKDLTRPMANSYSPKAVESAWYPWWEQCGFFKPELTPEGNAKPEGTYVIPIPPPNVTGSLHLGHALTNSIQDAMIRWNRMLGKTVLWNPGCDHAGIATQVVVEKKLWKEQKKSRHDLGRTTFTAEVWKWKDQYGDRIYNQLRRLGGSFDWDRAKFTMDPDLYNAVQEAFIRLHDEGIIYRENRLVNWCTSLKTALSNLEVENVEIEGRTLRGAPDHDPSKKYEFGMLASFAYPVDGSDEEIVVATTRLETMLGDTAVAVHPDDERYKHLVGKNVRHPFQDRLLPIIADSMVDKDFGTGAVKITPAHDFNDFEAGKRNNLPSINILNEDGSLNKNAAPFEGVMRYDAREAVEKELEKKGLFRGKTANKMMLPICGRSNNVVEPLMKPQWWVRSKPLAEPAIEAVRNGTLEIVPKTSEKDWFAWLENIQDWCISRQLWWGHSVPAYLVHIKGTLSDSADGKFWVAARTEEEAMEKALAKFPGTTKEDIRLEADPDVLDTWFSSGLWPFSIFGWPNKTKDLELYYPNALLETGWDILFFWVARMVMMGIRLTGEVPFKKVFCHAMVRDRYGRKMSKSLGNVVDPLDVIEGISLEALHQTLLGGNLDPREVEKAKEGQKRDYPNGIPECGTDALRFALCNYTSDGRDINLDILRVEGYRKFCNKLWNATKLTLKQLGDNYVPAASPALTGNESLAEKYILSKLNTAVREANRNFEVMNFMALTNALYSFWQHEFCDIFLEVQKPVLAAEDSPENLKRKESMRNTLYTCLDFGLRLLHPFMPFITEELYQRTPRRAGDKTETIMRSSYPQVLPEFDNEAAEAQFSTIMEVVRAARSLTTDYDIKTGATVYAVASSAETAKLLESEKDAILAQARPIKVLEVLHKGQDPAGCALYPINDEVYVLLLVKGVVDIAAEVAKLEEKKIKTLKSIEQLKERMDAPDYMSKVKQDARDKNDVLLKSMSTEVEGELSSLIL